MKNARFALQLAAMVAFFSIAVFAVLTAPQSKEPDYEAQANCVAEYDYTHPERNQMDNLVIALRRCSQ